MKRKIIMLIVIFLIIAIIAGIAIYQKNNNKTDSNSTVIKMNEVTRSVFYAPQYVAINNGYLRLQHRNRLNNRARSRCSNDISTVR